MSAIIRLPHENFGHPDLPIFFDMVTDGLKGAWVLDPEIQSFLDMSGQGNHLAPVMESPSWGDYGVKMATTNNGLIARIREPLSLTYLVSAYVQVEAGKVTNGAFIGTYDTRPTNDEGTGLFVNVSESATYGRSQCFERVIATGQTYNRLVNTAGLTTEQPGIFLVFAVTVEAEGGNNNVGRQIAYTYGKNGLKQSSVDTPLGNSIKNRPRNNNIHVACFPDTTYPISTQGDVFEAMVYDRALTISEMEYSLRSMTERFESRFGIKVSN